MRKLGLHNSSLELSQTSPLLTDSELFLSLVFFCGVVLVLSLVGIIANWVNIKIFLNMGVEDSVTISFLVLACADLLSSLAVFGNFVSVAFVLGEMSGRVRFVVDPILASVLLFNITLCLNTTVILTTVYIAVARCFCVVKPLKFRSVFTRNRSLAVLVSIAVFSVGVYMPIFAHTGAQDRYDPVLNNTRVALWTSPQREQIKDPIFLVIQTILPFTAQFFLILCVAVMARALLQTSQFRNTAKRGIDLDSNRGSDSQDKASAETKLSGKELQAVQQVLFISLVFIICNTPTVVLGIVGMTVPGFNVNLERDRYWRLYSVCQNSRKTFEQINSSVNICFYFRFNSKFREYLQQWLKAKK